MKIAKGKLHATIWSVAAIIVVIGVTRMQRKFVDVTQFKSLTIYDVVGVNNARESIGDDLQGMVGVEVSAEDVQVIFSDCKRHFWPPQWKGHYMGIAESIDGQMYEIRISLYGGFF